MGAGWEQGRGVLQDEQGRAASHQPWSLGGCRLCVHSVVRGLSALLSHRL